LVLYRTQYCLPHRVGLAISVNFSGGADEFCITQGNERAPDGCNTGFFASEPFSVATDDDTLKWHDTQCGIFGNWALTLVSEPSALASLATPLNGMFMTVFVIAKRRLVQGLPSSGRAGTDGARPTMRRRYDRARMARPACMLAMR
jgi:hypothetical protein